MIYIYPLCDRQFSIYRHSVSTPVPVRYGMPQGILGPILFSLRVLVLACYLSLCYADDTQLYIPVQASDSFVLGLLGTGNVWVTLKSHNYFQLRNNL